MISFNVMLMIFSMSFLLADFEKTLALQDMGPIDEITENIAENIRSQVEKTISEALNNSKSSSNASSAILSTGSNVSSSQVIISNNQSVLASAGQDSFIMNRIEVKNGQCTATKI